MRNGATLPELVIGITLLSILALVTLPPLALLRDQLAVQDAAARVRHAHTRARLAAVAEQRVSQLLLTADSLVVRVVEAPGDTAVRWRGPGPGGGEVRLTGLPRTITFAPTGVAFGVANGTYEFSRGSAARRVIVSRYGRVREE
ncbi:MAG: GspH/FimT family pseudopilin [Gemmatimonadales bacterium]